MRIRVFSLVALLAVSIAPLCFAGGFNPGNYPGIYNSFVASSGALTQSGVITTGTSNYAACEFFNNTGAAAYFAVYNSATVAGQATTNIAGACQAPASNFCSVTAGGPSGPSMNAAIVGGNGLSWFGSSTFPAQAGIGANGWALCTINIY